jgi:cytochrome c-type biogenesis protein CcmF
MHYLGEHSFWSTLGRLFVALSFAGALIAAFFYGIQAFRTPAVREERPVLTLRRAARWAFGLHSIGVLGTIAILFTALFNHWFEFDYVWRHSSLDMPMQYIASCFWEGQEGSFLLWLTWHMILGWVLIRTAKTWEYGTLFALSLVQLFLASMLLGIYLGDIKLGSSPFILIRELPENLGLPWTEMSDYLMRIPAFRDGQGLNPLLQNYWMVIHPPTLFLGFAAVTIPFLFAMTGLFERRYTEWVLPALPWTFFGIAILGTGVLMGGAWAYEALSFGGFWAWDPVENSSLVPWLTLVAAGHLMMVVKHKKTAPATTIFLAILSFLLVLYSTFLTRSGILGDTSVHAFVDLGLNGQLLALLGFFTLGSLGVFFWHQRHMPKSASEDTFSSREFWMFIGALTLLLSAAQITFSTSIPVLNKLIGPDGLVPILQTQMAPPADAAKHYNSLQIPFALIISVLMGIAPFLRWKETPKELSRRVLWSAGLTLILTALVAWGLQLTEVLYIGLLGTALFAFLANADYWLRFLRGKWTAGGMALAHLGFALVLIGALISNAKKEAISTNATFIHQDFPANENILLPQSDTVSMYPYYVSWKAERTEGHNRVFDVEFYEVDMPLASWADGERNHLKTAFTLHPFIQMNARMGNVREPSTQHFWNKDIYTYVSYADLRSEAEKSGDWKEPMEASLKTGDEVFLFNTYLLHGDTLVVEDAAFDPTTGELTHLDLALSLTLKGMDGSQYPLVLPYHLDGNNVENAEVEWADLGIKIRFDGVKDEDGTYGITAWEKKSNDPPFILMQAFIFPYINLLWLGSILMGVGSLLAVWKRIYRSLNEGKK